jgi:hypothetical protein
MPELRGLVPLMALVAFEYDWIPGQRPNGLLGEDPVEIGEAPKINTVLAVKSKNVSCKGVVTVARPDVGGITVLGITLIDIERADAAAFVQDLRLDGAVEVALPDDD